MIDFSEGKHNAIIPSLLETVAKQDKELKDLRISTDAQIKQLDATLDAALNYLHKDAPEKTKDRLIQQSKLRLMRSTAINICVDKAGESPKSMHIHTEPEVLATDLDTGELVPVSAGGHKGVIPQNWERKTKTTQPEIHHRD